MLMVVLLRAMESHPSWAIQSGHVTGTLSLPMNVTGKSAYAVSACRKSSHPFSSLHTPLQLWFENKVLHSQSEIKGNIASEKYSVRRGIQHFLFVCQIFQV